MNLQTIFVICDTLHMLCIYMYAYFLRVFFLNISEESIKERLTHRRTDPITGEMCVCMYQLFLPLHVLGFFDMNRELRVHKIIGHIIMTNVSYYGSVPTHACNYYDREFNSP